MAFKKYVAEHTIMLDNGQIYPAGYEMDEAEYQTIVAAGQDDRVALHGSLPFRSLSDEDLQQELNRITEEQARRKLEPKMVSVQTEADAANNSQKNRKTGIGDLIGTKD